MKQGSLRVLHVIPSMGYGGAERQATYLAHGLVALGHEVHFALFTGGENLPLLRTTGATIHSLAPRGNYDPRRLVELDRLVRRLEPDVVQTWLMMANVLGGFAAHRAGVPWVVAVRCAPDAYGNGPKVRFERWLTRRHAGAVISNSASADALWAEMLEPPCVRGVIRNAIPLDGFDGVAPADPVELGLPPDLPLIVYVGRMHRDKGIDTLIDALLEVNAERPVAVLMLGVGELLEHVRARLAAPAFGGRAAAPGFRLDATAWLKRAAAFVSLSHHEGMPNTVMEAMAMRCPTVVSAISQHREILDPENALFVPIGDAAAAAAAIRRTLDAPEEAAARAGRARRAAEGWSIEATSRAWADLYQRILAN